MRPHPRDLTSLDASLLGRSHASKDPAPNDPAPPFRLDMSANPASALRPCLARTEAAGPLYNLV